MGRIKHTVFLLKCFWLWLFVTCVRVGSLQVMEVMVNKCAAFGCMTCNEMTRRYNWGKFATFHFPKKKPGLNEKFISLISRHDWSATRSSVICELHFEERFKAPDVRDRLKRNLNPIPSIHSKPAQVRPSLLPMSISTPRKSPKVPNVQPNER